MNIDNLLYSGTYFLLSLLFLLLAVRLFVRLYPYQPGTNLVEANHAGIGLVVTGYLTGVLAILGGVLAAGEQEVASLQRLAHEIGPVVIYALTGMAALLLAGWINERTLLRRFSVVKEIVHSNNTGVAAVLAASYLGSGLIIAGGIHGSVDIVHLLIALVAGQGGLLLFSTIYCLISSHDELAELVERRNHAVGVAWAGHLLAFSLLLMTGLAAPLGEVMPWSLLLQQFIIFALLGAVCLSVTRLLCNRFLLPGQRIFTKIVRDHDMGAAFLEGGVAIGVAMILIICF